MDKKRILIITPARNEEQAVKKYITGLEGLTYPRELIDLVIIENDSSDDTYAMLQEAVEHKLRDFNSVELQHVVIRGPARKQKAGEYWKDVEYGKARAYNWIQLWNEHIQPIIDLSDTDYVLMLFADCVPPGNVIQEYLKVFDDHEMVGWVGGVMFRRYPLHMGILSPYPEFTEPPEKVIECPLTGHCWLMPTKAVQGLSMEDKPEVFYSITEYLAVQGLRVMCTPEVYLRHVSTDGKIYANPWYPEAGDEY